MNKNTRHIKKSGTIGQSGITQKKKQKIREVSEANIRQPIQATQNHSSIKGSLKKEPAAPHGTATPLASLEQALEPNPRQLFRSALIVAAYLFIFIILDLVTKQYQELPGIVVWYPPAGLTYALLLVFGIRFVPAVTIALLIDSVFVYRMPQPTYLLFLWALIISLIYGAAAGFLRHVIHIDWQLRKFRDVTWFVITAIIVSAILAVLSVMSSALSGNITQSEILKAIFDWWIGETVGVLTIAPFLMIVVMPALKRFMEGKPLKLPKPSPNPHFTPAVIAQGFTLIFMLYWVFGGRVLGGFQPLYLITLPLIWIALDHGFKGATMGVLVMNFGVMLALSIFRSDLANLGELQLLMIVNGIVGLFMGAVVTERRQAEQVIQASEKKFRQLFENSPLGQSMTEINGSVSVNNTFCEMLGYTKEELSNKKWQEMTPEEDIPDTEKNMQVLLEGKKESVRFEKRFIHKNGSTVWAELNSFLNRDAQGNPIYFITTINDITDRKGAEERFRKENELKNMITMTSPVGITMVDRDGVIRFANPRAEQILGLTKTKLANMRYNAAQFKITAINGDPFPEAQLPFNRVQSTLKPVNDVQHAIVFKNKKRVLLSINAAPLLDENGLFNGMVASLEDITERRQAEEELQRSEMQYRSLTENSPDLIARFDRQYRHLFVNSIAAKAGRYSKKEYIGKTIAEVGNSEQVAKKWEERIKAVFKTGQVVNVEDVFETSGGPRFFSTKFVPEFSPDGSVFSVQSIASDVTDRKQAELNYQMLFQSMLDGFALHEIILNKKGKPVDYRFLSVNPAFERITGLKEADIKGRTVLEVLPATEKTWIENYGMVALTGEPMFFENYARELGKHFEVSVFCPAPLQFVTVFVDITERKQAEVKIQQLNRELEQRVKDRTTKLEAANQELDAFAYSVSHDLRAPLRSMEGFSEALKIGYPEKLDEQGQHYLTRIQEASLEMGQLIEALLSLSRVTRNELKSESIDLSRMAREIADEMKKQNPKRKVEIEIAKGMEVQGDTHLLKIAMENLVNNAFKFTSNRDQAHITIEMKKEPGETVYFVRDDGVGFDMAYASKLFVPFQRLHAKEKFPGSGIGLATVKRIITRHGGRIWAEAGVDQGAAFYFTIGGK